MKIYFRLCRGNSFYDKVIRWYTRGNYTHAEFAHPLTASNPYNWLGAQPSGGVQVRTRDYLPGVYDVYSVQVDTWQLNRLEEFLSKQIGKPYDWKAIIRMGLRPFHSSVSSKRWFCSELVFYGLFRSCVYLLREPENKATRISPRDLALSTLITLEYRGETCQKHLRGS